MNLLISQFNSYFFNINWHLFFQNNAHLVDNLDSNVWIYNAYYNIFDGFLPPLKWSYEM